MSEELMNVADVESVFSDISTMIYDAKNEVMLRVNTSVITLYWNIGKKLSEEVLQGKKPEYGKNIIGDLSKRLTAEYGKGYTKSNLYSFYSFYKTYPEIFQTPSGIFNMPEYRIHRYCCFRLRTVFACRRRLSCPLRYKLCHSHTSLRYQRGLLYRRLPNQRR